MSDFISILFGVAELLFHRDFFSPVSFNESKEEKKKKTNVVYWKEDI